MVASQARRLTVWAWSGPVSVSTTPVAACRISQGTVTVTWGWEGGTVFPATVQVVAAEVHQSVGLPLAQAAGVIPVEGGGFC